MNKTTRKPGRPKLAPEDRKQINRIAINRATYNRIKAISINDNKPIMTVVAEKFQD